MTTCAICRNTDMRRIIELGWNAGMTVPGIAHAFGMTPSVTVIRKHLNEHRGEGLDNRSIVIEDERPTKVRIEELQRKMLDDLEGRIRFAEERAAAAHASGNLDAQPSDWFDMLDRKNQAAIASLLKMQDQTDKRAKARAVVAVDIMKLMGGGLPPSHLIEDGVTIEADAREVDAEASQED